MTPNIAQILDDAKSELTGVLTGDLWLEIRSNANSRLLCGSLECYGSMGQLCRAPFYIDYTELGTTQLSDLLERRVHQAALLLSDEMGRSKP